MQEYSLTCRHPGYGHVTGNVVYHHYNDQRFTIKPGTSDDPNELALKWVEKHVEESECVTSSNRRVFCEPTLLVKLTKEIIKSW